MSIFTPKHREELQNAIQEYCEHYYVEYYNHHYVIKNDGEFTKYGFMYDWDVSNVTNMSYLFAGLEYFDEDISSWDVSNVTNMEGMFEDCVWFNCDIDSWDVSNVENLSYTFSNANSFNADISGWNISKCKKMIGTFYNAEAFSNDLSKWKQRINPKCEVSRTMFYNSGYDYEFWDCTVFDLPCKKMC